MSDRTSRAVAIWAFAVAAALLLSGCGLRVPTDPDGTLDRVTGGTLRVGLSPHGEFTRVTGTEVEGSEVTAVEEFAEAIDAEIDWTVGSEEALVRSLEAGELDLVIGGITDETPWSDKAGMTRPHDEFTDARGEKHRIVMLVPLGENAFLSALETDLFEESAR